MKSIVNKVKNSDKDSFIEMLKRAKIDYKEEDGRIYIYEGYQGFYTVIDFKNDGQLESIEAYE